MSDVIAHAVTAAATNPARSLLVIKHGALGDFVQAFGPFQAIRRHHPDARIVLLTTEPYRALAEASGWFDDIWIDARPAPWQPGSWLALRRRLLEGRFDRVYDLQTSDRTGWYFRLIRGAGVAWSGIASGCSHPHDNPARDQMHTMDRHADQLARAGIAAVPPPDLRWFDAPVDRFSLPPRYALLVPGGAAHRPAKRWPADRYAVLGRSLDAAGVRPVLVGGPADRDAARAVMAGCAAALDLTSQTSLFEIAGLARRAVAAVGNDTGPMHVAAAVGCPVVTLFSDASEPALCAPRGQRVTVLRRPDLHDLPVAEVEGILRLR